MREVVLRIPRIGVEDVLDRLLLIVPGGVRESRSGGHAELRMRGGDVPALSDIEAAVGRWPIRTRLPKPPRRGPMARCWLDPTASSG